MNEVFDVLKDIIVDQLGVEDDLVTMDTSFTDDLEADSLDMVELMMAIEEEYDIEISEDDAETIVTVGDAVSYINSKI